MTDNVNIIKLTAAETAAKIASGELTAVQVTEAHLARIEAVDEKVQRQWKLGHKSEQVARAALAEVRSKSK